GSESTSASWADVSTRAIASRESASVVGVAAPPTSLICSSPVDGGPEVRASIPGAREAGQDPRLALDATGACVQSRAAYAARHSSEARPNHGRVLLELDRSVG